MNEVRQKVMNFLLILYYSIIIIRFLITRENKFKFFVGSKMKTGKGLHNAQILARDRFAGKNLACDEKKVGDLCCTYFVVVRNLI